MNTLMSIPGRTMDFLKGIGKLIAFVVVLWIGYQAFVAFGDNPDFAQNASTAANSFSSNVGDGANSLLVFLNGLDLPF